MRPFAIARPRTAEEASALVADERFALPVLKAGGMDVVDHLKEGLIEPDLLVDVRGLGAGIMVSEADGRVRIEAMTTLAEIAASPVLARHAPVVAQAVADAATPQVRSVATAAGNLLQRPRCWYYRNEQFHCLKRGGHTCYAVEGENRYHAIFGEGPCHIVHPSNLAPALYVCGGTVHLVGTDVVQRDVRAIFHGPESGLTSEHVLVRGEVVTHITLAPAPKSGFYAVKEKQSFDWPLVMAAAALEMDGSTIRAARICAGAVAPVPWPLPKVEAALRGVSVDDATALAQACAKAADGARPMSDNAYKVRLLPVAVRRAVLIAAGRRAEEV